MTRNMLLIDLKLNIDKVITNERIKRIYKKDN